MAEIANVHPYVPFFCPLILIWYWPKRSRPSILIGYDTAKLGARSFTFRKKFTPPTAFLILNFVGQHSSVGCGASLGCPRQRHRTAAFSGSPTAPGFAGGYLPPDVGRSSNLAYPVGCQSSGSVIMAEDGSPRLSDDASRVSAGFPG